MERPLQSSSRTKCGAVAILALGLLASPAFAAEATPAYPLQPTHVVRSVGGVTDDLGMVPGMPDLCRMQRPDGAAEYDMGSWRTDGPGAGLAYPAIRAVLHGGSGTRASFATQPYPGLQFNDTFVHEGPDPLTVDGMRYATIKLAHGREGTERNTYHSVGISWRDEVTGIVLKMVERQISGQSHEPNTTWVVTRVERLP